MKDFSSIISHPVYNRIASKNIEKHSPGDNGITTLRQDFTIFASPMSTTTILSIVYFLIMMSVLIKHKRNNQFTSHILGRGQTGHINLICLQILDIKSKWEKLMLQPLSELHNSKIVGDIRNNHNLLKIRLFGSQIKSRIVKLLEQSSIKLNSFVKSRGDEHSKKEDIHTQWV